MHPYGIIKKLEQTAKTNEKLKILKSHKDNESLRQFFYMCLEPTVVFGLKKIPDFERSVKLFSLDEAMMELYKFSSRELTGNAAIEHLQHILQNTSYEAGNLIQRIIAKDPGCKVAESAVNKTWKNCITVTPYMRCKSGTAKNLAGIKQPAFAQEKADGLFMNVINENRKVNHLSRNGKEIDLLGNLQEEILAMSPQTNFVIHGEGLVMSEDGIHFLDRKTGNGIINKAIKGTITQDEADRVHLVVWDVIPLQAWKDGKCDFPYDLRFAKVSEMVERANDNGFDKIMLIDTVEVEDMVQAKEFFEMKLDEGREGAVLKNKDGIWKDCQSGSKDQVKMKNQDPADLMCVGTIPHSKQEGWIGSLIMESSDQIIKVNTGSGLDEADRQKSPDEYIGKVIELEYNEITVDKKTKQKSLFLPIFKGVREDKSEADSYELILERAIQNKKNRKKGKK
jgi:hypothetical protein